MTMQLIGRYFSPYARRVGVTLQIYGLPYEHTSISAFGDDKAIVTETNPIGRIPILILDDGEALIDSATILDYLDELVGPEKALTPPAGVARRRILTLLGIATGAVEKAVQTVYEVRFRPEEKRHAPWVEMCAQQAIDGFEYLDRQAVMPWMRGDKPTQADVTVVSFWEFLKLANADLARRIECPNIVAIAARARELPAFQATIPQA